MNISIFGYKPSLIEALIGAIVLIIVIFWLYRKIDKEVKRAMAAKAAKELEDSIVVADLSFDLQTYKNYADKLEEAMQGAGSDEDSVYSVFRSMVNNSDVLKLITVFGTRTKEHIVFGSKNMRLAGWLTSELDESELTKVNTILSDKDITIAF